MKVRYFDYEAGYHNNYLFEKIVPPRCKKPRKVQTIAGPLVSDYVELDTKDLGEFWMYTIRNGKIAHKRHCFFAPLEQVHPHYKKTKYDTDYVSLVYRGELTEGTSLHYGGPLYKDEFEVYLPGGLVRSRFDDDAHAFDIRNEFLTNRAAEFAARVI